MINKMRCQHFISERQVARIPQFQVLSNNRFIRFNIHPLFPVFAIHAFKPSCPGKRTRSRRAISCFTFMLSPSLLVFSRVSSSILAQASFDNLKRSCPSLLVFLLVVSLILEQEQGVGAFSRAWKRFILIAVSICLFPLALGLFIHALRGMLNRLEAI